MTFIRRHPLVSFFVLAYGLSWAYWTPLALAGVRTAPGSSTTHEPGLLGPALAGGRRLPQSETKRGGSRAETRWLTECWVSF